jgi:hypothetical protein
MIGGHEDARGDREVEPAAFLGQVRRSQVDGHAAGREFEAAVGQSRTHAVLALLDGRFEQADDGKRGQARAHVDLDPDHGRVESLQSAAQLRGERHHGVHEAGRQVSRPAPTSSSRQSRAFA